MVTSRTWIGIRGYRIVEVMDVCRGWGEGRGESGGEGGEGGAGFGLSGSDCIGIVYMYICICKNMA